MENITPFNPNFLNFTKQGFIDYEGEKLSLDTSHFWWEELDWKHWAGLANRNKTFPIFVATVYLTVIFTLQALMKHRKPFVLKRELAWWNGALGLFSIVGVVRVAPDLWGVINQPDGVYKSLCVKSDLSMKMAFWGTMFVMSKIVELGDTLFIVLRKKPLQVLQYYHHAVSLTLAYITGPFMEPICRYYICMNYGIHSLMYPYFSLRALDIHIPRKLANVITSLQLVQMVVGVGINTYTSYLYWTNQCHRHPLTIQVIWLVYGSFVILFGELFYRLVIKKGKNKRQ